MIFIMELCGLNELMLAKCLGQWLACSNHRCRLNEIWKKKLVVQGETGYHGGHKVPMILNLMCFYFFHFKRHTHNQRYKCIRSGEFGEAKSIQIQWKRKRKEQIWEIFQWKSRRVWWQMERRGFCFCFIVFVFRRTGKIVLEFKNGSYSSAHSWCVWKSVLGLLWAQVLIRWWWMLLMSEQWQDIAHQHCPTEAWVTDVF